MWRGEVTPESVLSTSSSSSSLSSPPSQSSSCSSRSHVRTRWSPFSLSLQWYTQTSYGIRERACTCRLVRPRLCAGVRLTGLVVWSDHREQRVATRERMVVLRTVMAHALIEEHHISELHVDAVILLLVEAWQEVLRLPCIRLADTSASRSTARLWCS